MEIVYSTGSRVLKRKIGGDSVEIVFTEYPLYPYTNYVSTHLLLKRNSMEMWRKRESWGGTGTEDLGHIKLHENEYKELYERLINVKSVEDFKEVVEIFEEMLKDRERRFSEMVDRLTQQFADIYIYDRALNIDKEVLEKLKKDVKDFIEDWLTA